MTGSHLRLAEGAPPAEHRIGRDVVLALTEQKVIEARVTPDPDVWLLRALRLVGVAQVGGTEVRIEPKLPVRRLLFLLGYARNPQGWRQEDVHLAPEDGLVEAMARLFLTQAERALARGLLQGYRTVEDTLPVLRGRLRESDQLRRRPGIPLPLEVRFDEFSPDILENQTLKAAALRLLSQPLSDPLIRNRLRRLALGSLAEVSVLPAASLRGRCRRHRLNARYGDALVLADLVLSGASVEPVQHGTAPVRASGFLFNLATVFENFLEAALREHLAPYGGHLRRQYPMTLDDAGAVRIRPDLVWEQVARPQAVLDAKYKREMPDGYPDADLYQMLAYCTALGLRTGYLVYAEGDSRAGVHTVRHAGTRLITWALDLDQAPAAVLADVAVLARRLAHDQHAETTGSVAVAT